MRQQSNHLALIVVEAHSSWPAWDVAPGWQPIVVEQREDETLCDLCARVQSTVATLQEAPRTAVFICSERADSAAQTLRQRCIGTLLRSGAPELEAVLLASSERASGTVRRALAELAASCNEDLATEQVSVWFGPRSSALAA